MMIDPVCGMQVDPATAKWQTTHEGKPYYFCAKGCLESFEKSPERFLSGGPLGHMPKLHSIAMGAPLTIAPPKQTPVMEAAPPNAQDLSFGIRGMSCASCVARIEDSLRHVNGVHKAAVNLAMERGTVAFDPARVTFDEIRKAVEEAGGYEAYLPRPGEESAIRKDTEYRSVRRRFLLSAVLTVPVVAGNMLEMTSLSLPRDTARLGMFVLTTLVLFGAGGQFFTGFWRQLRHLSADMNSLIAIGTSAAYLYSSAATFVPQWFDGTPDVYYDTAAVIITLILFGRALEARARYRTTDAIRQLMSLAPKRALRLENGQPREVPISELQVDDIVLVRQGDQIPADGIIIKGSSAVNESMITGEPLPVGRGEDDQVIGGTINTLRPIHVQITQVGEKTRLAQIIRMVEKAQSEKAPIQRLADRVAGVFVPIVIAVALVALTVWLVLGASLAFALQSFIAVLIIACPCALGLATPTAIVVGTGKGAQEGILIKNGESLEIAHKIDTVAFDKTGTLTEGKPEVTALLASRNEKELLQIAGSIEKKVNHPIATAIVEFAKSRNIDLREIATMEAHGGKGVSAMYRGKNYAVGSVKWLSERATLPESWAVQIEKPQREGATVIGVLENDQFIGLLVLNDRIREDSRTAIQLIHGDRIHTVMITGDHKATAEAVARKVGVEVVYAEVQPEEKAQLIASLQKQGRKVAMVGDGINDAPALAQSDLGIAVESGTDVALETSDITLMRGDLHGVYRAIHLSRKTMSTIRQNLFWAFCYNVIGIPIAAGLLYPFTGTLLNPMIASATMALSSVFVVGNSLLLRNA